MTDTSRPAETAAPTAPSAATAPSAPGGTRGGPGWLVAGLLVVVALGVVTHLLTEHVPEWTDETAFGRVAKSIEFPVYAIALGLLGNVVLTATGLRGRLSGGFRTEFFIKTGLVLLGASINFAVIVKAAGPAVAQAALLITIVFFFTWWLAGRLGVDDKLRALLATAVSICGVSAAIAAAGAVRARKEQLAYTASLVIIFALPSIFLLPWLSGVLGLTPAVTGAWIGGNIDTTAAVTAAGTIAGEQPLQIATIVKVTQNALLGVAAVALTAYFAFKIERVEGKSGRPSLAAFWQRFPKFVLGFLVASVIATIFSNAAPAEVAEGAIDTANSLRTWFLILAFVSIGLEFRAAALREVDWKPIVVFAGATVVNLLVGLGLASLLFAGFTF